MLERACLGPVLGEYPGPIVAGYYVELLRRYYKARPGAALGCVGVAARIAVIKLVALVANALMSAVYRMLSPDREFSEHVDVRPGSWMDRVFQGALDTAVRHIVEAVRLAIESEREGVVELPLVLSENDWRHVGSGGLTLTFKVKYDIRDIVKSHLDASCTLLGSIKWNKLYACRGKLVYVTSKVTRHELTGISWLVIVHGPPARVVRWIAGFMAKTTNPRLPLALVFANPEDPWSVYRVRDTPLDDEWLHVVNCAKAMVKAAEREGLKGAAAALDKCIASCRDLAMELASGLIDEEANVKRLLGMLEYMTSGAWDGHDDVDDVSEVVEEYAAYYKDKLRRCARRVYGGPGYDDPDDDYGDYSEHKCRLYYVTSACADMAIVKAALNQAVRYGERGTVG